KVPEHLLPPSLQSVINILDPDGLRLPTFYIYDSYNEELHKLRKRKRELQKMTDIDNNEILNSELLEIENKLVELEKEILKMLSSKLSKHIFLLLDSVEKIKYLDVIISKAKLAVKLGLSRPKILRRNLNNNNFTIKISGMFNPQLREELESKKKVYQPVDITVTPGVTVIVGANMSGKSVVLRTVALIQYMAQLGFFVPARDCETEYLEHIALICEDFQKPLSGLSSFGAEILLINEALDLSRKSKGLVLIDEPARTTNPYEGTAIVNAIVESFKTLDCYTLIVTHLDYVNAPRRLRVKGLKNEVKTLPEKVNGKANELLSMLQDYIDYQLVESA
ncbi:MAG: MutS-related protein, partial [Fervidobacterium pennivorans]